MKPHIVSPSGTYSGTISGEATGAGTEAAAVHVYKGIRYALAPTGERRWRDPVPVPEHEGVTDATIFGAISPQPSSPAVPIGDDVVLDEDCLFLNVWRPASADGTALPVMVWLHGGAYILGSGSAPGYDGSVLAASGDVIIVTINYRLSAFGFLDLSGMSSQDHPFDSNLALKDVLLALQWVQENISSFGGDPDRVTLFGQSAGAGLVTTLLAVPKAAGLFSRAIVESSPVSSIYGVERAQRVAERFMAAAGVTDASALRAVSADIVRDAGAAVFEEIPGMAPGTIAFAPVVDHDLVPEAPITVLSEGRGHAVPLLIGTTRDEASFFKYMKSPLMPIASDRIRQMFRDMHAESPEKALPREDKVLSAYSTVKPKKLGLAIARDVGFRMPTLWAAAGHSTIAPVWVYRFEFATPFFALLGIGATHAAEVPYVWGNLTTESKDPTFSLGGKRAGEKLSMRMRARWAAFAHGEHPNVAGACAWPPFDTVTRNTLMIGAKDSVLADPDAAIRAGWGSEPLTFP